MNSASPTGSCCVLFWESFLSRLFGMLFITLAFSCVGLRAAVTTTEVESDGDGATRKAAFHEALLGAVSRVNGMSVEGREALQSVELSVSADGNDSSLSSEALQKSVETATKGLVQSYDIVSETQDASSRWTVRLRVRIAKYETTPDANRRRLAVMPLRTGNGVFRADEGTLDAAELARQMGQGLTTFLVQTRKFTVLDREYMQEACAEKLQAISGNPLVEELARLGAELSADYILVATLSSYEAGTESVKMRTSDRVLHTTFAKLELGYRVIDVATRQVKFSAVFNRRLSDGDVPPEFRGTREGGFCQAASAQVARRILEAIYPILVVEISGPVVTLNVGGDAVRVGERFIVLRLGDDLRDPYTRESLGRSETPCATIEITRVMPKFSQARVVEGEGELGPDFEPKSLVCRADGQAPRQATADQRRGKEAPKDDNW